MLYRPPARHKYGRPSRDNGYELAGLLATFACASSEAVTAPRYSLESEDSWYFGHPLLASENLNLLLDAPPTMDTRFRGCLIRNCRVCRRGEGDREEQEEHLGIHLQWPLTQ